MSNKITTTPSDLLKELVAIIEEGKQQAVVQVNSALTLVFWQVGQRINKSVLNNQRAAYGKELVNEVSVALVKKFGRSFEVRNLRRMMQFAVEFPDFKIVVPLARQLSWSQMN